MKKEKQRLYIAYGSNLNVQQMLMRCPDAKIVAKSWLHDFKLVFQGQKFRAHANVIPSKGDSVPVAIWKISERDERNLDIYEGVKGGYYYKEYMEVEVGGEMKKALIYIMSPNDYGIPEEFYLKTIAMGYKNFNFDTGILDKALQDTMKNIY